MTRATGVGPLLWTLATVRFLAELGMLAALGYVGWRLGGPAAASVLLALFLPLVAAACWATWVAPRARRRLGDPARLTVELALFAGASLGLLEVGPLPGSAVTCVALWAAFLLSLPVRRRIL